METTQADLARPLLEDEERAAAILEEWNASVTAFVAENGGADNTSCYCESIANPESNQSDAVGSIENSGYGEDDDDDDDDLDSIVTSSRQWRAELATRLAIICTSTLLPDDKPILSTETNETLGENQRNESIRILFQPKTPSGAAIKFLKFVFVTIASIALVRTTVVANGIDDRDTTLTLHEIAMYEGDSILRDLMFFFVVGRMHQRSGVDTLEWIGFGILANLYFESQTLVSWMQHSATPYEMHCVWPWQLWVFAIVVVMASVGLGIAHAVVAYQQDKLWRTMGQILLCVLGFILPVAVSPYAHFHHWFAGWFLGMHTHLHDKWWSRATMAYCWGMYVNGIAVYGRDPLLTCDYARFLARDQGCPMLITTSTTSIGEDSESATAAESTLNLFFPLITQFFVSDDPPDWRNCTSSGYHP